MLVEDQAKPTIERGDQPPAVRPSRRRAALKAPPRWFRWRGFIALGVVVAILAGLAGGGFLAYSTIRRDANQLQDRLTSHFGLGARGVLSMINQVKAKIDPVRGELSAALKAADSMDVSLLPSSQKATFLKARGTIGLALTSIDQFKALVPILVEILGGTVARTYLIEQVNPAELRPGGGSIGSFSLLRADHGILPLTKNDDVSGVSLSRGGLGEPNYVEPPGPIREWLPYVGWSFYDSNFFADFPSNARKAEDFAQQKVGHIDAVIALDYFTVAKMLEILGPLPVPGYNMTLTSDNFINTVVKYDLDATAGDKNAAIIHKAILIASAGPLLQKCVALQPAQWPALIGPLNDLASSRHLQAYFNNPHVQKTIAGYRWAGDIKNSATADYLMEVEAN